MRSDRTTDVTRIWWITHDSTVTTPGIKVKQLAIQFNKQFLTLIRFYLKISGAAYLEVSYSKF